MSDSKTQAMIDPPPKLLTFDCYGTLIDWDSGIRAYLAGVLARKGAQVDLEEFYARWYHGHELKAIAGPFMPYREVLRVSLQGALREFELPVEPDDGDDFGIDMQSWEAFPESAEVLARLAQRYPLAVISNSQHDIIRHALARLGNPFRFVITAQDAGAYKPDPRPFQLALDSAGVAAADVLHIAQSQLVDLPRAKPMGMRAVWINRHAEQLRPGTPAPDYGFPDLRPLPEFLGCA